MPEQRTVSGRNGHVSRIERAVIDSDIRNIGDCQRFVRIAAVHNVQLNVAVRFIRLKLKDGLRPGNVTVTSSQPAAEL